MGWDLTFLGGFWVNGMDGGDDEDVSYCLCLSVNGF